jgi:lactoylglutathione lyase
MVLHHAAIDVADVDRSVEFYRERFDMEPAREDDGDPRQVWVGRDGGIDIQLRGVGDVAPADDGVDHVALAVENVDAVVDPFDPDQVVEAPRNVPEMGLRVAFVTDPDGYVLELVEELD